ncbi:cholesterol oxidase-like [Montipora capricornis]|uniref:cholesterol oxidase-like n=1 Tax=Montipora capricornis TaxID=246305 RepID=UPI0035F14B4E
MSAVGKQTKPTWAVFPILAAPNTSIKSRYDVVIVGSGYGGSIAASRCARAGQSVCVLEKGKEWRPGDFSEKFIQVASETQVTVGGLIDQVGKPNSLFDFFFTDDLTVAQGCGLGGTSLINASVAIDMEKAVFRDSEWPKALRNDSQALFSEDRRHFYEMIKPLPYPDDYPHLFKFDRLEESVSDLDIEDLDKNKLLYKLDLYVTFEDKIKNNVGVPQPKCTACGNCIGGCNVGAKNTLNMNYLPDAKAHGAELFTEVEVLTVERSADSTGWDVTYKRLDGESTDVEHKVQATFVILGAGAIGSTKVLLRSKANGLNISNQLGKRFSTNGDVVASSFWGKDVVNAIGIPFETAPGVDHPPGPTITTIADFRPFTPGNFDKHHVVQDFGIPVGLASPYIIGLAVKALFSGDEQYPDLEDIDKFYKAVKSEAGDKSLTFLGMSHDDARGVISYNNGIFDITWEKVGCESNFFQVNRRMKEMTDGLGGTYVPYPKWAKPQKRSVLTGHPLGGCSMGESGKTAVVNHAGQVFDGNTDNLLDGLMVVDGSIVPRPVGVNPTLTIGMLAERCIRLLAERQGWTIDYDTFTPLVY